MCQTVLYFDQNLSETENTTKIGNNQYIKDNMSQILLSPIQFLKWVNMGQTELSVLSLGQNLLETLQNATQIELYIMLIKIDQSLLNGQHGSAHIVPD